MKEECNIQQRPLWRLLLPIAHSRLQLLRYRRLSNQISNAVLANAFGVKTRPRLLPPKNDLNDPLWTTFGSDAFASGYSLSISDSVAVQRFYRMIQMD